VQLQVSRKEIPPKRRRQILNAATELFSQGGYHGVTVDAIAQRAGISKGNLYWYFKSKQEILQLLFDDVGIRLFWPFVEIMESDRPPRDRLLAFAERSLDSAEKNPEALQLMWQIATQPELRELLSSEFSLWMTPFIDYLKPLFAELGEANPESTAMLYALTLDSLMFLAVIGQDLYDREKLLAALREKFIDCGRKE
jgi:AcrR family transcriptional regulator